MEDTWELEAGVEGPPGVRDVERSHSHRGNWRGPPRPGPAGLGAHSIYNPLGKWWGGREGVGGGRSSPRPGKPVTWRRASAWLAQS